MRRRLRSFDLPNRNIDHARAVDEAKDLLGEAADEEQFGKIDQLRVQYE